MYDDLEVQQSKRAKSSLSGALLVHEPVCRSRIGFNALILRDKAGVAQG